MYCLKSMPTLVMLWDYIEIRFSAWVLTMCLMYPYNVDIHEFKYVYLQ